MTEPVVRRDEVESALAARHELGAGYDEAIVDGLVDKIERRLEARPPAQPTRWPDPPPPKDAHSSVTPLALGSIALGIPVTAVALSNAPGAGGIAVAIVAWAAIALVNLAHALAGRRRR